MLKYGCPTKVGLVKKSSNQCYLLLSYELLCSFPGLVVLKYIFLGAFKFPATPWFWLKIPEIRPIIVNYSFIVTLPQCKNLPQNAAWKLNIWSRMEKKNFFPPIIVKNTGSKIRGSLIKIPLIQNSSTEQRLFMLLLTLISILKHSLISEIHSKLNHLWWKLIFYWKRIHWTYQQQRKLQT